MPREFLIRLSTLSDAEVIGWHRARMFQDMGMIPAELFGPFRDKSVNHLRELLASGEYIGWLTSTSDAPEKIIAGAGVIVRPIPPFPLPRGDGRVTIADGRQGLIVNVFTEPEWRRRGLAKALMEKILAWSRDQDIESLILHASDDGRSLYEQLGFIATNEMRLRC